MSERAIDVLERWELCGGTWRVAELSEHVAELELCTCDGAPVDRLRSTARSFIELVTSRREASSPS
jgi:hypothetical protein